MNIITNYNEFLNENINFLPDIIKILELIKSIKTEDILAFRDSLSDLIKTNENINEGILTDIINKLKAKFKKTLDDRIWKYLINRRVQCLN